MFGLQLAYLRRFTTEHGCWTNLAEPTSPLLPRRMHVGIASVAVAPYSTRLRETELCLWTTERVAASIVRPRLQGAAALTRRYWVYLDLSHRECCAAQKIGCWVDLPDSVTRAGWGLASGSRPALNRPHVGQESSPCAVVIAHSWASPWADLIAAATVGT